MEGRYPKGILIALTNCTDPQQEADFNRWYDQMHLKDVVESGAVTHPLRFRNIQETLGPGEPRYLALYESDWEDQKAAYEAIARNRDRLTQAGRMHPTLDSVLSAQYCGIGPEARSSRSEARVAGLLMVTCECKDPEQELDFNEWYNHVHLPEILDTGVFHTAYRYHLVTPPGHPRYLALYETDLDPEEAAREFDKHRPKWVGHHMVQNVLDVKIRGNFRRLSP